MEFNDFPILTNDEYDKMRNEYINKQINNHELLYIEICNKLFECKSICIGLNKFVNKTIRLAVEKSKNEIDELYSDLSFSFKIKNQSCKEIKNFDVFSLLKNLVLIINSIQNHKRLNKDYLKDSLLFSIESKITIILKNIIQSLCESNIYMFKHI